MKKNKKYKIIYADPPWNYDSKQDDHAGKPIHYKTMSLQEICNLPINEIADDNCVLLIWGTNPLLKEVIKVGEAWGFKYKTKAFCWIKKNKKSDSLFWGQGYYTRSNSEDCFLFVKGKNKRISAKVHQVIISRIREHSRKPDEIRDRIVELFGDLPRIELFARQKIKGWDIWGNELENDIEI
jgi:N6-adenosine-specific RNA methylase IME4